MADVAAMDIKIGADISQAVAAIERLTQGFSSMGKEGTADLVPLVNEINLLKEQIKALSALKLPAPVPETGPIKQYEDQIKRLEEQLKKLEAQLTKVKATPAVSKVGDDVKKGTDRAGQALTDFSRIVQDSPYVALSGNFGAIANNINPMLESFQRLQKESGSAGGALKQMVAGLSGAGGIGVAVSVVSSLLVVFGDKLFSSSKKTEEAAKATDVYAEALKKAEQQTTQELTKVETLISVLQRDTATRDEKKKAVEELIRISPEYFNQLKTEKGLVDTTARAYIGYINALNMSVQSKAALASLDDVNAKLVKISTRMDILNSRLIDTNNITFLQAANWSEIEVLLKSTLLSSDKIKRLSELTGKSEETIKGIFHEKAQLMFEQTGLLIKVEQLTGKIKTPDIIKPDAPEKIKETAKAVEELRTAFKSVNEEITHLPPILDKIAALGKEMPKVGSLIVSETSNVRTAAVKLADAFNEGFGKTIEAGVENTLAAFGEAIGNLISGKSNPFAGVFDAVAGIMESLGKTLIGLAIGLEAIQTAIKTLNPVVAAAAGVALIALAQVIKNSVAATPMATGGVVTGPIHALIGEKGPEAIIPLDRLNEFMQTGPQVVVLETRVRGDDLYLIQSRTNQRRGRSY
jgi:hypothetical protein